LDADALCYDISLLCSDGDHVSFLVKELVPGIDRSHGVRNKRLYEQYIMNGTYRVLPFREVRQRCNEFLMEKKPDFICAYNYSFDRQALGITMNHFGSHKPFFDSRWINSRLEEGVMWSWSDAKYVDIWLYCCKSLLQDDYRQWCQKERFFSSTNRYRTDAEASYAFLTRDKKFKEVHVGLPDNLIEDLLMRWLTTNRPEDMRIGILNDWCWEYVQKKEFITPGTWYGRDDTYVVSKVERRKHGEDYIVHFRSSKDSSLFDMDNVMKYKDFTKLIPYAR